MVPALSGGSANQRRRWPASRDICLSPGARARRWPKIWEDHRKGLIASRSRTTSKPKGYRSTAGPQPERASRASAFPQTPISAFALFLSGNHLRHPLDCHDAAEMAGGLVKYRHLSRKSSARQALLRGLVTELIHHEHIQTTYAKAKEAQRLAEKLISYAKRNNEETRRKAQAVLYVR